MEVVVQLVSMTCSCGIVYGIPETYRKARQDDHKTFYCPNGCNRHYPSESIEEKLRKQLHAKELEATRANQALTAEQRLREAAQRDLKSVNTRIKAGVCPCCNRTFKQLATHMKRKHPETTI